MRKIVFILLLLGFTLSATAQEQYASWSFSSKKISNDEAELSFIVDITPGFYLYGLNIPPDGPRPLVFNFEPSADYELVGKPTPTIKAKQKYDDIFKVDIEYHIGSAIFTQKVKIKSTKDFTLKGSVEYQTCNDELCLPGETDFSFKLAGAAATENTAATTEQPATTNTDVAVDNNENTNSIGTVEENTTQTVETSASPSEPTDNSGSLWGFFFIALGIGLAGALTPCVFPMIPMTVSFFMGGSSSKFNTIVKAIIFCLSITLIYTLIGVIVTVTKSPALIDFLTTNWIINFIFFLMFVIFACSFLGLFELTLPSSIANKADQQVDKGGFLASFFLALALTIVSFSCTGPFVGGILIEAISGGLVLKPIVGMFGFGLGLALPFFVLALIPSLLKKLPKSGGWLNSVKVFFAFIMLAFSFKFLIIVDQHFELYLLSRNLVLSIWVVLFFLLGLYLLGKIKFSHDSDIKHVGVFRFLLAVAVFVFALRMFLGLFGLLSLESLSAFLPAEEKMEVTITTSGGQKITATSTPNYQSQNASPCNRPIKYAGSKMHLPAGIKGTLDLKEGLACAKELNRPVLLDFKGHSCANCKKMEASVFTDPRIIEKLNNEFVVIALYVDDDTELPEAEWVTTPDGKTFKTVGRVNRYHQQMVYKQMAQPYFIIVDADEKPLSEGIGYVATADKFLEYLNAYQKK